MKNALVPSAKRIFTTLRLLARMSAADAAIQKKKKNHGSGITALLISNEEIEDLMKTIKSLEKSGFLVRGISDRIKNKAKEQKGGFLRMLLRTLAASMLGNPLT